MQKRHLSATALERELRNLNFDRAEIREVIENLDAELRGGRARPSRLLVSADASVRIELWDDRTFDLETDARTPDENRRETLRITETVGGLRHTLDGQPVSAGTILELETALGWLTVRYEWTFRADRPAMLEHVARHGSGFTVIVTEDTRLRWGR